MSVVEKLRRTIVGGGKAPSPGVAPEVFGPIKVSCTIPNGAPAKYEAICSFAVDPRMSASEEYQLPSKNKIIVNDLYVTGSQSINGTAIFYKNGVNVTSVGDINSLLVSNPQRPRPLAQAPVEYDEFDIMKIGFVTESANSSGNDITIEFYIGGIRYRPKPGPR